MDVKSIIDVRNLTKKFRDVTAVDGISFSVTEGEIFAFLGPNGAGKTTTIKMLTTLLRPTGGVIRLNGFDPETQMHEVRHSFGIVFQDPSLDDELTAYENLLFHAVLYGVPVDIREKRITELLGIVELSEKRKQYVKTFSGGMKRRLEIARGLLHHPKILFLDEPSLGLDPQTRKHMWDYIVSLNKSENITVFLTTHYIEEAEKVAQTVAVIDHGKIVRQGTSEDLKRQTKTTTLEEAFLELTGHEIRDEEISSSENMMGKIRLRRRLR